MDPAKSRRVEKSADTRTDSGLDASEEGDVNSTSGSNGQYWAPLQGTIRGSVRIDGVYYETQGTWVLSRRLGRNTAYIAGKVLLIGKGKPKNGREIKLDPSRSYVTQDGKIFWSSPQLKNINFQASNLAFSKSQRRLGNEAMRLIANFVNSSRKPQSYLNGKTGKIPITLDSIRLSRFLKKLGVAKIMRGTGAVSTYVRARLNKLLNMSSKQDLLARSVAAALSGAGIWTGANARAIGERSVGDKGNGAQAPQAVPLKGGSGRGSSSRISSDEVEEMTVDTGFWDQALDRVARTTNNYNRHLLDQERDQVAHQLITYYRDPNNRMAFARRLVDAFLERTNFDVTPGVHEAMVTITAQYYEMRLNDYPGGAEPDYLRHNQHIHRLLIEVGKIPENYAHAYTQLLARQPIAARFEVRRVLEYNLQDVMDANPAFMRQNATDGVTLEDLMDISEAMRQMKIHRWKS